MCQLSTIMFAIAIATSAVVQINAFPIWEDENGNNVYLIPIANPVQNDQNPEVLLRPKRECSCTDETHDHTPKGTHRETTFGVGKNSGGQIGQKVTYNGDDTKVSAHAYAERNYNPKGPLTTGQSVDLTYKPSETNFKITAENTRGQGTDLTGTASHNLYKTPDHRGRVDVGADYQRHYGGQPGNSDPKYNVFIKGTYDLN